jgi:dipeptidyl aminopeptidase/acylaminoacyl peptidase
MWRFLFLFSVMTLTIALPCVAAAGPTTTHGTELFFSAPRYSGVSMSPDGRRLAMSVRNAARSVITVYDIALKAPTIIAQDSAWDLIEPIWVDNNRLIYKTWDYQSTLGNNQAGAIIAINVDGTQQRVLWDSVQQSTAAGRQGWSPMTYLTQGDRASQEILVTLTGRSLPPSKDRFSSSDVYAVNTQSGKRRLLTNENPGQVQTWVVDSKQQVRAALAMRGDPVSGMAIFQTYYRAHNAAPWEIDHTGFYPAGVNSDGNFYVVGRSHENTEGLYRWDFKEQRPGELLLRHPAADIGHRDLLYAQDGQLVGVDVQAMKPERHFFREQELNLQETIDLALPEARNRIYPREGKALVISSSDTDPGSLYLYDKKTSRLEFLFKYFPTMSGDMLSKKKAFIYRARDGYGIPAYITLPRGKPTANLPLVVFPHGGPAERDSWGNYWEENEPFVQLLAARGYAVLQPQYRGSSGFGWALHRDGWKQWDGISIDDLVDGVNHVVQQGLVDPKRVCSMGKSAGGYAAMYALIKYPDVFRCGVSWAGTTDMELFFTEPTANYANTAWLKYMTPWTHVAPSETSYMATASVARNAHRIRVPVLLAYGSADYTVPLVHGQKLHEALVKQGTPVEWTVFPDEGHGWTLERNKLAFALSVERFLAQHLLATSLD